MSLMRSSCETMTTLRPSSLEICLRSRTVSCPDFESRFAVGSSARMSLGSLISARAMATRCFSPPESFSGKKSSRAPAPPGHLANDLFWKTERKVESDHAIASTGKKVHKPYERRVPFCSPQVRCPCGGIDHTDSPFNAPFSNPYLSPRVCGARSTGLSRSSRTQTRWRYRGDDLRTRSRSGDKDC